MSKVTKTASGCSPSTLQRILTADLRPGMFLVRVVDSWWKSPFFTHRRLLHSSLEVEQLVRSGIKEVEIDTSLGVGIAPEPEAQNDEQLIEPPAVLPSNPVLNEGGLHVLPSDGQPVPSAGGQDAQKRAELVQLREDLLAAVEEMFHGVKTGQPISRPVLHAAAQNLVQEALLHPTLLAEMVLIDALNQFDKTLYAHVVDTAVYAIVVGLQLKWNDEALEKIGVGALLHDVGYMRLPQNVVKEHWNGGGDSQILQQHVAIGEALLRRQEQFSEEIVRMVGEHHAYQDGSGYAQRAETDHVSEFGQLLGVMDYFDELLTVGGIAGSFPAALAIRRMYQEAQKGKFATRCIEAMIRTFGVFPVGTVVQLSLGEQAVVLKQNLEHGLKPQVKIFQNSDGKIIKRPWVCDLAKDSNLGHDVSIVKVLEPSEYTIHPREYL